MFSPNAGGAPRCGTRIGDTVIDLGALAEAGIFSDCDFDASCFGETTLNTFMSLGRVAWSAARKKLLTVLSGDNDALQGNGELMEHALYPLDQVGDLRLRLPPGPCHAVHVAAAAHLITSS